MKKILEHATFLENALYHASDKTSWSELKVSMQSPLELKTKKELGASLKPSPAMTFGSLVHAMRLEPQNLADQFAVGLEFKFSSKADKDVYIDYLIELELACEGERATLQKLKKDDLLSLKPADVGVRHVSQADWDKAEELAAVLEPLMPDAAGNEAAFYATLAGVECQCKVDYLDIETNQVKDIKTTANIHKWCADADRGDLLYGDVFYRMVIEAQTGILIEPIEYVGISTVKPYQMCVRKHPERFYHVAKIKILAELQKLKACRDTGIWPGIDNQDGIAKEVQISSWKETELENEAHDCTELYDKMIEERAEQWPWEEPKTNDGEKL